MNWIPNVDDFVQHEPTGIFFKVCARTRKQVEGKSIVTLFDAIAGVEGRSFSLEECRQTPRIEEWGDRFELSVDGNTLKCTATIEDSGSLLVRISNGQKTSGVSIPNPQDEGLIAANKLATFFEGSVIE